MATYPEYTASTMAPNDFQLYPYSETWNQDQSYQPASTYAGQQYLNAPAFHESSFGPLPDRFAFEEHTKGPYHSPANSASHSFEYSNPPHLSCTSDSGHSALSSAIGSPSAHGHTNDWETNMNAFPAIVMQHEGRVFGTTSFEYDPIPASDKGCVDPSLIQPCAEVGAHFPDMHMTIHSPQAMVFNAASPMPSGLSLHGDRQQSVKPQGSQSPFQGWQHLPEQPSGRRPSISSVRSKHSHHSHSSDDSNKGLCPIATCGRYVKDLKAHMLTHQNERPEKCPIPTCLYHIKGFARKYDKNRHTLTHYKGTMVCGFCPGSGSAAEKSFNRADVFKRHLTSVHGVEQTPPNARRKSPASASKKSQGVSREASGMCSTCSHTFASAQDFYEHLDDCVLRVVQQADPSEANNERNLTEISQDREVQETLERHNLPTDVDMQGPTSFGGEDEAEDEDDDDEDDIADGTYGKRSSRHSKRVGKNGGIVKLGQKKGLTLSKHGVPLVGPTTGKGSKRRKNYPLSWGAPPAKMKMKKRVLCVYDGQRRLWKDDMMLDADHEVRVPLNIDGSRAWVTDLDIQTLRRSEAILNATEEEKGPWKEDAEDLERLMS